MSRVEWIAFAALALSVLAFAAAFILPVVVFRKGILSTFLALSTAAEFSARRAEDDRANFEERRESIRNGARRASRSFSLSSAGADPITPPPSPQKL